MKTKFLLILIICFVVSSSFSQVNLNDYKYVIVSKKYDFLKEADQYQLNSLSVFKFNKFGFKAFMEGAGYPEDLIKNRCLALKADALLESTLFKSKIAIQFTDCNDKVVYTSSYGESRLKDFDKAYSDALREAFKNIEKLNHKYTPKESSIEVLESENNVELIDRIEDKLKSVIKKAGADTFLYAQPSPEGFLVVDGDSNFVMTLLASPKDDFFIVKGENTFVYKEDGIWHYVDAAKEKHVLNLKF